MPARQTKPDTFHVKPSREGLVVRYPNKPGQLPPEGETVERTTYWRRRVKQGDVVAVASQPRKAAPKPKAQE